MKIKLLTMLLGMFLIVFPNVTNAKKSNINMAVKDQHDCAWSITGWVEYSILPPKISDYDVWAVDCHGNKYHFTGMIISGTVGNNLNDFNYTFAQVECPQGCNDNDKYFVFNQVLDFVNTNP